MIKTRIVLTIGFRLRSEPKNFQKKKKKLQDKNKVNCRD